MRQGLERAVWGRAVFSAAVVLCFLFFLTGQLNFYLAESLKNGAYLLLAPVLTAGAVCLCRPKGKTEYRLLLVYMLWVVITRVLNGDHALSREYRFVLDLSLMLPFLLLGLTLDRAGRRRLLNWLSVLLGLYFFALGLACIAAFLLHTEFYNPITGGVLAGVSATTSFERANILDTNPNAAAYWFFMPLTLMLYQFFACRRRLWRIPIVLSALVDWLVICLSFSRSVRLAAALCFALLAALLCARALKDSALWLRALAVLLAFALLLPLGYKAGDWASSGIGFLSRAITARRESVSAVETAARPAAYPAALAAKTEADTPAEPEEGRYTDPRSGRRGLDSISSERLSVWRALWQTLRENPRILLFGSASDEGLALVNAHLAEPVVQCHNFLLQTLLLAGLPGLLCVLLLCVLLLAAALRMLFSALPLPRQLLCLPVLGSLLFGQLEAGFFNYTDARALFFYLMCGVMLGEYYDSFPAREQ